MILVGISDFSVVFEVSRLRVSLIISSKEIFTHYTIKITKSNRKTDHLLVPKMVNGTA